LILSDTYQLEDDKKHRFRLLKSTLAKNRELGGHNFKRKYLPADGRTAVKSIPKGGKQFRKHAIGPASFDARRFFFHPATSPRNFERK
jgi:hypothetical protein